MHRKNKPGNAMVFNEIFKPISQGNSMFIDDQSSTADSPGDAILGAEALL